MKMTWKLDDCIGSGTSYKGEIITTFDELEKVFGEPNCEPSDKTWNEWNIEFRVQVPSDDDGMGDVDDYDIIDATIYDWKESGPGSSRSGLYRWHIGGRDHRAVELVYDALERFELPSDEEWEAKRNQKVPIHRGNHRIGTRKAKRIRGA